MALDITAVRITRAKWSSEKAFVLATAAAAVGLGNVWRFPYIAGENGGAAFIIAYLIAILVVGIPLMIMEVSAGKVERGSPVKTFRSLHPWAGPFGWLVVGLTMLIMSYYLVITGWTMGYAVDSLTGNITAFSEFTDGFASIYYFFIVTLITALVVARGLKLIELLSKIMMPLFLLIILFLTGYSLTLPGAGEAMSFLFSPDFSNFLSPTLWVLAFGQAFYSLAIGQGYLITYGSFLPDKTDLPRATGSIAGIETAIALIAGLMIFPLVFTFGLQPDQGADLAFSTLPLVFASVPFGGILAIGFFWLFFLAALSSAIAGMEVVKTALREELRLTQGWATAAAFLPVLPLGIMAAFSFTSAGFVLFDRPFLEVLDMFAANQVVIVLGLAGGAIIAWTIPRHTVVNGFSNRFRPYAAQVINTTKYLWIVVVAILLLSFII